VGQLEIFAALLGVMNVMLVIRRSIWNYPSGIAMVSLYFFIFYDARLYADALLQIFFLVIQLYGWSNWLRSGRASGTVVVERLGVGARLAWLAGTAVAVLVWGAAMARFTDAAAPFLDSAVAGLSVSAQWLLALRKIESWALWIVVDLLAIGLFLSRGLEVTAALYALFLLLAVAGLFAWARRIDAAAGEPA
jgi:nicotinamide mononucleotide transporter